MRLLDKFKLRPSSGAPSASALPIETPTGLRVIDEHFTPESALDLETYIAVGDLTAIHHLARYLWARDLLPTGGTSLLDLGCGSGYGSYLMAEARPEASVIGIDYDAQAVEHARRHHKLENLSFAVGDPTDWERTLGASQFDAIACFDVIEHVQHRELLLEAVAGHLHPQGQLFFSTPCASDTNNLKPGWEHHRIEYSTASLYDFLGRYFSEVLLSEDPSFPGRALFEALHARGVLYELRLNPVICRKPIRIANPYRS